MAIKFINETQINENIGGEGIKIVNAFADWCGPCKMLHPILEDLSNDYSVAKVDIDQNKAFVRDFQIQGVPSTFIFKDGVLKDKIVGFVPKEEITNRINKL